MPGPAPKPAPLRQRRNKASTKATLPTEESSRRGKVPKLPEFLTGKWHPGAVEWWNSIWRSPMASEYLDADRHRIYRIVYLMHDFWTSKDRRERMALAAEIARQETPLGVTPIDRRRLQWEVEKGEQAEERTKTRRQRKGAPGKPVKDPREVLRIVS